MAEVAGLAPWSHRYEERTMKTEGFEDSWRVWLAALACVASFSVRADPPTEVMNITRESEVKWVQSPFPGLATAVIMGNPNEPGKPYVVRARFSPGTFSPPHFHP